MKETTANQTEILQYISIFQITCSLVIIVTSINSSPYSQFRNSGNVNKFTVFVKAQIDFESFESSFVV